MPRSTVLALILIQNQTRLPRLPLLPRGAGVRVAQSVLNSFQQSALPVFCCSSRFDKRHSPKTQSQRRQRRKKPSSGGRCFFYGIQNPTGFVIGHDPVDREAVHDELFYIMRVRVCTGGFYLDLLANGLPIFSDRTPCYFGSHRQLGDSGFLVSLLAGYWASRRSCSVFIRSDNSFRCSGWVLARFSASPRSFFRL